MNIKNHIKIVCPKCGEEFLVQRRRMRHWTHTCSKCNTCFIVTNKKLDSRYW
jgi:uncharacterized Zn finger protein